MRDRTGAGVSTTGSDRLYAHLREAILSGRLAPGVEPFGDVAGVSVDPDKQDARDAFSRLNFEGLLSYAPQRGVLVSLISVADVREALFIRKALETGLAAEAALRMSDCGKFEMRQNLRRQRTALKSGDLASFYAADVAFHEILTGSLRLNVTAEILRGLHCHLDRIRRGLACTADLAAQSLAEHLAIMESIAVFDDKSAAREMAAHLQRTADRFEAQVRERPWEFDFRRANGAPE